MEMNTLMDAETLVDLVALRRDLHAHPELGFEEQRTAAIVAARMRKAGLEVETGIGGTGVVATLRKGNGNRAIALRADMDALAMSEKTGLPYASTVRGAMHACGHDGHTTMLLAAAEAMVDQPFSGTVHFVFQPAEEGRGGAKAMIEDSFLDRFPVEAIYGLHNMPGLDLGVIAAVEGPQLASSDSWSVTFSGIGSHGAKPHQGRDAVTAAGIFLMQVHTIVAREVDPLEPAVVSACALAAGDFAALNVIPHEVKIGGTARAYSAEVRDQLEAAIGRHAKSVASGFEVEAHYHFLRRIPPVVNAPVPTKIAQKAAIAALGEDHMRKAFPPSTAGDDFAEFGTRVPGAYVWLGMGQTRENGQHHNTNYDFNDDCIPYGVAYWCSVIAKELG
jgi:hippurate hydrolase